MMKKAQLINSIIVFILMTLFVGISYFNVLDDKVGYGFGIKCKSHTWFDKDKYCKAECGEYDCSLLHLVLKSHKQDAIDQSNKEAQAKRQQEESDRQAACYNAGNDYEYNFTIYGNYNLSCKKVAYINDHLIDQTRQVDGGYIHGESVGFFSYGHIEGHLYSYVTKGVLATGQLMKHISYHLDCNNQTSNLIQEYFTESEFVMEYVERCIE